MFIMLLRVCVFAVAVGATQLKGAPPAVRLDWDMLVPAVALEPLPGEPLSARETVLGTRLRVTVSRDPRTPLPERITVLVRSPARRLRVLDVRPEAIYEADAVEPIVTTKSREATTNLGLGVSGPIAASCFTVTPNATLGRSDKSLESETRKRPPQQSPRLLAGPADQGRGVQIVFLPGGNWPLEGTHVFDIRWAAPRDWRGETLSLSWDARNGGNRPVWPQDDAPPPSLSLLAAYRIDDPDAEQAAAALESAWHRLGQAEGRVSRPSLAESIRSFRLPLMPQGDESSTSGMDDYFAAPSDKHNKAADARELHGLRNEVRRGVRNLSALR